MKKNIIYSNQYSFSCWDKLDDNIDPNLPLTGGEIFTKGNLWLLQRPTSYAAQARYNGVLSRIWTNVVAGNYYYAAPDDLNRYQMNVTSTFTRTVFGMETIWQ